MSSHLNEIELNGFAIVNDVLEAKTVNGMICELENINPDVLAKRRSGKAFGIRNLLNVLPSARNLVDSWPLRSLVEPLLGSEAKVVRGIYFDKYKEANWKVAWHQDLTIAVRTQIETEDYGPWSIKAGIPHVQPPASILENMLTLRLHLDDTNDSNGALRVIPGSHRAGRLDAEAIQSWKEQANKVTCTVSVGGVLLMKPLLLHASMIATNPSRRRVLHFEYSANDLPNGLEWFDG